MFRQHFARFSNSMNDAFRELGLAEMISHGARQFPPKSVTAFCVNADIADHRELAGARGHKNQHAISFWRLGHAQTRKLLLRGGHRILDGFMTD